MGFECVMCMETLETPAPADIVHAPQTEPNFNEPGPSRRTNPENTQEYRSNICATSCGHIFHRACLNRWFSTKPQRKCPSCRKSLGDRNIFHIYPPCVSEDFVHQKALQLTEIESGLPQCDCGSPQCDQLYDIHKTLVSDHGKLLVLLQRFTDQCDNKTMLEARVASLEEECARLRRLETPSTSGITGEPTENSTRSHHSHRRHLLSGAHFSAMHGSMLGHSSSFGHHRRTSASDFDEDFDDNGDLISRIRTQARELERAYNILGDAPSMEMIDLSDSSDEASDALVNLNSSRDLALDSSRSSRRTSSNNLLSSAASNTEETADASIALQELRTMRHEAEENLRRIRRESVEASRRNLNLWMRRREISNASRNLEADTALTSRRTSNSSRNLESLEARDAQEASTSDTASRNRARSRARVTALYRRSLQRNSINAIPPLNAPDRSNHTSRYVDSLASINAFLNIPDYSDVDLVRNSYSIPNLNASPYSGTRRTSNVARNLEVSVPTSTNTPDRVTLSFTPDRADLSLRAREARHAAENRQAPRVVSRSSAHESSARRNLESPSAAHSHRHRTSDSPRNSGSRTCRSVNRVLHPTIVRARTSVASASNRNRSVATTERLNEAAVILTRLPSTPQGTPAAPSVSQPPADSPMEESNADRPDTPLSTTSSLSNNVSDCSTISVASSTSADRAATLAATSDNRPRTSTDNNTQRPSTSSSRADNSLEGSRSSWAARRRRLWSLSSTARPPPPPRIRRAPLELSTPPATSPNSENLQREQN